MLAFMQDIPPEDSAPAWRPDRPVPSEWGVTTAQARDLLRRQMCPICSDGPWKSPLIHVARKHGIDRHTMRDVCGLTTTAVVADPELSDRLRTLGLGRDMAATTEAGRRSRRTYRMTQAGKRRLAENLAAVTPDQSREALTFARTPTAQAKRSATLRAKWAEATPEERAEWGRRVGGDREHMDKMLRARWEKQVLQPCGTVAAYKRGCRCPACREAKRASRS